MRKAFKYRLYPNRSQAEALDATLETHRRLYNLALRERRDVYEAEERSVSYGEQSGRFKETRKNLPSFAATNFSSAQATLRRLDKAFKAFFRRVKASPGEAPGLKRDIMFQEQWAKAKKENSATGSISERDTGTTLLGVSNKKKAPEETTHGGEKKRSSGGTNIAPTSSASLAEKTTPPPSTSTTRTPQQKTSRYGHSSMPGIQENVSSPRSKSASSSAPTVIESSTGKNESQGQRKPLRRVGYPRFKPEGRFRTVEFPSYGDGCRLKDNGSSARLYLQHVGHIKVKLHRPVEGTIKTVSVKRSFASGKWYVIFSCDLGAAPLPEATGDGPAVGIDLGLKSFLVTSDGLSVEPPRYYRKASKKLRVAQRSLSRKKKGSGRRRKAREKVAQLHEKTANQRRDFHHKQARKLVNRHGVIAHEALNVKGIARTRLAESTHDAGWASFLNILAQKAEEAAVRVVAVDPRNTTQMCSNCGGLPSEAGKKTLSDRVHSCPCGYVADRDVNAALNILKLGQGLCLRDVTQRVAASVSREAVCFS